MKEFIKVKIDHVGIISKDLATTKKALEALGFCTGGDSKMEVGIENEAMPTNAHFMFDNTYVECIQTNGKDYLAKYLQSESALHTLVLCSDNMAKTRENFINNNVSVSDIMIAKRPANHGLKTGEAVFSWVQVNDEIVPNTLLGIVDHKTRELIFQPHRHRHKNGINLIKRLYICADESLNEQIAEKSKWLYDYLEYNSYDTGIFEVCIMDKESILKDFGLPVNPERSNFVGVSFECTDKELLFENIGNSGFRFWDLNDNTVIVDVSKELGLFFIFEDRDSRR